MRNQPFAIWTLAHGPLKPTWYVPTLRPSGPLNVLAGSMNELSSSVAIVPFELIAALQRKRPPFSSIEPTPAFDGVGPLGPLAARAAPEARPAANERPRKTDALRIMIFSPY